MEKADHRTKPRHRCGKIVFEMVKDIKVVFGKGPSSRSVQSDDGRAPMWKKKSIFWELPYWEVLGFLGVNLTKKSVQSDDRQQIN